MLFVLRVEPRALDMLCRHSTTKPVAQANISILWEKVLTRLIIMKKKKKEWEGKSV